MGEKSFNKANYLTVKDFAQTVEKSVQSVYKRIERKENRGKYLRTYEGRKYIHKAALWELYGIDTGFNVHISDDDTAVESDAESLLVKVLREEIAKKDKELEAKNIQIAEKDKQIAGLFGFLSEEKAKVRQLTAQVDNLKLSLEDKQADHAADRTDHTDHDNGHAAGHTDHEQPQSSEQATQTAGNAAKPATETASDAQEKDTATTGAERAANASEEPQEAQKKPRKRRTFWQWFLGL